MENATPLQYSCLENPMDGGAWWAAVHGVTKSWTRLSDFTFTFHSHALEKEMATHSSVLTWRIPGTGEPAGLLSMGSHRVRHDWSDLAAAAAADQDRSDPWENHLHIAVQKSKMQEEILITLTYKASVEMNISISLLSKFLAEQQQPRGNSLCHLVAVQSRHPWHFQKELSYGAPWLSWEYSFLFSLHFK